MSSSSNPESPNQSSLNEPAKVTLVIDNFCHATDYKFQDFTLPSNNEIKFRLICYPQNKDNKLKYNYTTVYLYLSSCNKNQISARNRISFINANGDKCFKHEIIETFYIPNNPRGGLYHILYDDVKNPENGFLVNGKLSIYCEIEEIDSSHTTLKPVKPKNPLLANYQSLLESGKFSDVTLIVGGKKLLAHKNILSTQSKVFAAMFDNDCEEKRQNRIEITDIPVEVCEQMLRYIYTGSVTDLGEYAADLFIAADKYQLDHLKTVCGKYLGNNLSVESVASTLLLADMHQASELKLKCIDYITDNMTKVMATDGWKGLISAKEHVQSAARLELTLDLLKLIAIKTNR